MREQFSPAEEQPLRNDYSYSRKRKSLITKILIGIGITLAVLIFLGFLGAFVIFPLVFMNNDDLQRSIVFLNLDNPRSPEYTNYAKYGIEGVRNFYINVDKKDNITLGAWQILPEAWVKDSNKGNYDYEKALRNKAYGVVLHFHGVAATRITNVPMFKVLRKKFQIVAFDYRDFADSSEATLGEEAIVREAVAVYKWLKNETDAKIYVWCHSMGTGIGTHTVARLRNEGIFPAGLILEAAYPSLREAAMTFPLMKFFKWLAWFEPTMINPIADFARFETKKNILKIDPPIMLLHARDDDVLPFRFAETLYKIANNERNDTQGQVVFHPLDEKFKHAHVGIYANPELPRFIDDFVYICEGWRSRRD